MLRDIVWVWISKNYCQSTRVLDDVERVNRDSAVVHNRGVEKNYSLFDNTVATIAMDNGFGFVCQAEMAEMHEATVVNGEPSGNYDIYMGVFRGDDMNVLRDAIFPSSGPKNRHIIDFSGVSLW